MCDFFKKTLVKKGRIDQNVRIYPVSAKQGLTTWQEQDPGLWERNGVSEYQIVC
ncbi:MAG: hypothetical protein GXY48_04620 [Methanomicrobiales archaeon]|nr:hypothetical protein [Methanomicrobiales archaeon]